MQWNELEIQPLNTPTHSTFSRCLMWIFSGFKKKLFIVDVWMYEIELQRSLNLNEASGSQKGFGNEEGVEIVKLG